VVEPRRKKGRSLHTSIEEQLVNLGVGESLGVRGRRTRRRMFFTDSVISVNELVEIE
jgi:hypothetical protein